ncbi:MAG: RagB/SusD family nutrient uptake outer membrane protein [Bacteroidales bacterium]|nr:RagB/SusD family nutrient uptake outer membrane protein [Bacteroidales bacterium]
MNTRYILTIALCSLMAVSCDSFLDREPTSSANSATAIATTADAQVAINGIMRSMTSSSYYGRNFLIYGDAKGGDMTIYSQGRGLDYFYSYNQSPTSGSGSGFWTTGYFIIMNLNNLIDNILRLQEEGETGFDAYLGQAYTLRALVYFDLVRLYGLPYNYDKTSYGVPDITELLEPSATPSRATVEQNYTQILSDLEAGETLLEGSKSRNNGYINYYGNLALQARVALYMENWDDALDAAETIINSDVYTPYEPDEWVGSWASKYGSESIFELGMDSESDLGTASLAFYQMAYQRAKNAMGWFLASDYFLDRLGEDPTDVRWGIMGADEYEQSSGTTHHGACYKYSGSTSLDGDGGDTYTAVNIKVIRLSEIYLIAAEAALNTSDPDAAATYLNEIRRRSPGLTAATASTVTLQMILDERSKEFYGEGLRFFDLIRANQSITYNDELGDIPVTQRNKTIDRTFGKIVLPIDQDEINANPGIADQQNEAYN